MTMNVGYRKRKDEGDREEASSKKEKNFVEHKPRRPTAPNTRNAIRRQSEAGEGGEGTSRVAAVLGSTGEETKVVQGVALQYQIFDKVKSRLNNPDTYQEFLKCLNMFSKKVISRVKLQSLVDDILGEHADLLEGFHEFLTHCENMEGYLAGLFSERKLGGDFGDPGVKPMKEGQAHKVASQKDKYLNKPISKLDLSNSERCTPSYRLLPKEYRKPVCSHRTPLGISVLNDNWVSVTSGSEDYSFKKSRKNKYEESLFRCEDDRYELDMLLETTAATAKRVGEYMLKQEGENGKADALPPVEEFLSPMHLRCIQRIYGDEGLDFLEVLKKRTSRAMPVIHSRLVQKVEEWTTYREKMNKVWSEVYTKNVYKALDHRSSHFKQQDEIALSTESLLAEIKEMSEMRGEDDAILAFAAGNCRPLSPDFRHEFGNASIHDDLYQIIKYSLGKISSSPEDKEKTMRSLRTVLAPMMGIPLRRHCEEDMEEASDGKGNAMESGGGSEGDETSSPEGGGGRLGSQKEGATVGKKVENAVCMKRCRARILGGTDGDVQRLAGSGDRNVEECIVAENADTGVGDHGTEGANEVFARDPEGTAARTEGSGWLHAESSGRKQKSCLAGTHDKGEVSAQKSSEDSDNPSELADESYANEQSSYEQYEHGELSKAAGRIFYGNDMSYILSRLYQILYERILSAKVNAELAGKKKGSEGGAAPNLYSRFMQVLYGLLDGSLDNSKFGDECRAIIGPQSYILFTLDKLIFKLVKQLQVAAADEGVQKLLQLNACEYERDADDSVYYANACVVLHDESIYRFEHRSNPGELLIRLMQNSDKLDFAGNALGSPLQKYLDGFTKLRTPTDFRNQIVRRILKWKYAGQEQDAVIERALMSAKVVNGLEKKISCHTSEVSYTQGTEDIFLRCTARRFHKHKQEREIKKKQLFGDWLDKRKEEIDRS